MPQAKPKPSDIASEAKRIWIPYISQHMSHLSPSSYKIPDASQYVVDESRRNVHRLRVAVIDGDPVDVALDWAQYTQSSSETETEVKIPVVNMANEKRPGGDWESGLLAPEECFCRRSNLIHALVSVTPAQQSGEPQQPHYPLPQTGGIYSPHVVLYRDGPDRYQLWQDFKSLPVISVAPVRRPKLDESGKRYSFPQERELMKEKMRTVLRVAAMFQHNDIVMGAFGVGHVFRNPTREVARMWKDLLFNDPEFEGAFANVVFAVQKSQPGNDKAGQKEHEIFQEEFDPSKVFDYKHLQSSSSSSGGG